MEKVFAIRGATTTIKNTEEAILEATSELLHEIIAKNELEKNNIISILFSMTGDLNAVFPAKAARNIGIVESALMCMQEIDVPNSLKMCIRVMVHCYMPISINAKHVYLNGAVALRPDLMEK